MSKQISTTVVGNANQIYKAVIACMNAGVVPYIIGSPGVGKSSVVREIAKKNNLKLIDVRLSLLESCDLNGFPQIDKEAEVATYVPFDIFPVTTDAIPEGYSGWLLFLDELPSADRAVIKAAYKLILDRQIGNKDLHPKVYMVAAGNKATDNAIVNEIGTAMQSRVVTIEFATSYEAWKENVAYKYGYDPLIISYLEFNKGQLNNFDPDHNDHTFACQRTWEFVNKLIKNMSVEELTVENIVTHMLIAGAVGVGTAYEFLAFCAYRSKLPSIKDIIANPTQVIVPMELAEQWAIAAYIAREFNADNGKALIKYIQRLPMDMQVIPYRTVINANPSILDEVPEIDEELEKLSAHL